MSAAARRLLYFRDYECLVQAAIVAPDTAEVPDSPASRKLRGHDGILSVERYGTRPGGRRTPASRSTNHMLFPRKHEVLLDRAALVHVAVAREVVIRRRVVGRPRSTAPRSSPQARAARASKNEE